MVRRIEHEPFLVYEDTLDVIFVEKTVDQLGGRTRTTVVVDSRSGGRKLLGSSSWRTTSQSPALQTSEQRQLHSSRYSHTHDME